MQKPQLSETERASATMALLRLYRLGVLDQRQLRRLLTKAGVQQHLLAEAILSSLALSTEQSEAN